MVGAGPEDSHHGTCPLLQEMPTDCVTCWETHWEMRDVGCGLCATCVCVRDVHVCICCASVYVRYML